MNFFHVHTRLHISRLFVLCICAINARRSYEKQRFLVKSKFARRRFFSAPIFFKEKTTRVTKVSRRNFLCFSSLYFFFINKIDIEISRTSCTIIFDMIASANVLQLIWRIPLSPKILIYDITSSVA